MRARYKYRDSETTRAAAFLASCAPQAAYDWLAKRPVEFSGVFGTPRSPDGAHLLEYVLLRRREPLIDLGLAEFGRSRSVLRRLYRRSQGAIRATLCGNASLFAGDDLDGVTPLDPTSADDIGIDALAILQRGSDAEAAAFCSCPNLPSPLYDAALNIALAVPSPRGLLIVRALTDNPRLRTPRSESSEADYLDGFSEYEYNRVFFTAWGLAESAPVSPEWARVLANLFAKLPRGYGPNADVGKAIARWRNFPQDVHPDKDHSPASYVRSGLARNLKPDLAMLDDPDAAIRRAFYGMFDPRAREFRDLDWLPWLERDPHSAIIALKGNDHVWRTRASRQKLFDLLREDARRRSDYVLVGWARKYEEEMRAKHPNWFADEADPSDKADDTRQDLADRFDAAERRLTHAIAESGKRRGGALWPVVGAIVLLLIGYVLGRSAGY